MTPFERGFIKAAIEAGVPKEGIGNIFKSLGNKATDTFKSIGNKATDIFKSLGNNPPVEPNQMSGPDLTKHIFNSRTYAGGFGPSPLTVPAESRPSYMTNVVNGYKANMQPKADTNKLLSNTALVNPQLAPRINNSEGSNFGEVVLGNPGAHTNSVANESMYAHELGHVYDFRNLRQGGLSDYFAASKPDKHMQRELAADVNARRMLGTNYNQSHEATLAKALSTHLWSRLSMPPSIHSSRSPFQAALSKNITTIPDLPDGIDIQTTNAIPGYEALQQYAHKLMNDSYNAAYPAKPVDPQIAHLSRYLLH